MMNNSIINAAAVIQLLIGFGMNALVIIILVRYLYYPSSHRKDYLFTYVLVGFTVFLLCFMLDKVKMELGLALGLFAIFGILRYRTVSMPIKEMTYLFVIIAISVMNALTAGQISYSELLISNIFLILTVYGLENFWLVKNELCLTIYFDKLDLIKPEFDEILKRDLEKQTGLTINRVQVGSINFKKGSATINIFYNKTQSKVQVKEDPKIEIRMAPVGNGNEIR